MSTAELQIQTRRGTAAAWTSANPVLAEGEWGVETDTSLLKLGDGVTAWTSLAYWGTFADVTINGDLVVDGGAGGNPKISFAQDGVEAGYLRYLDLTSRLGVFADNNIGFYTGASLSLAGIFDSTQNLQLYGSLFATAGVGTWDIRHLGDSQIIRLRTNNSGGAERTGIEIGGATPDVNIFYDGTDVARTIAAASGGFEVNNTLTAAGFERVLTVSDLPTGVTVPGTWQYDNTITAADPGSGSFRLNNTTIASATALYIADESKGGTDFSVILSGLGSGDRIYLQNGEDSTESLLLTVATVADNTGWFTITFTVEDTGTATTWTNGKEFAFILGVGTGGGGGIGGSITDNQIAVGATTADEIEGTANLEFDDSIGYFYVGSLTGPSNPRVFLRGPANASLGLSMSESGAGTVASIVHQGVTNLLEYDTGSDHVFKIGGSERARFVSTGLLINSVSGNRVSFATENDVYIEGTTAALNFNVNNANYVSINDFELALASGVRLYLDGTTGGTRDTYIEEGAGNRIDMVAGGDVDAFQLDGGAGTATFFGVSQFDSSGNLLMTGYIDQYAGSGTANQGDILEWNSTNGRFEIVTPSGGGASTASGTWTVTLTALGTGTITLLSTLNELEWFRVGDLVYVSGRIRVSSVSSPTGGLQIGGLPYFRRSAGTDAANECVFPIAVANYTGTLDNVAEGAKTQSASAWFWGRVTGKIIQIRDGNDAGSSSSPAANMAANTELSFNFVYRTDDAI